MGPGDAAKLTQLLAEMRFCGVNTSSVEQFAQPILARLKALRAIHEIEITVAQLVARHNAGTLSVDDIDSILDVSYLVR